MNVPVVTPTMQQKILINSWSPSQAFVSALLVATMFIPASPVWGQVTAGITLAPGNSTLLGDKPSNSRYRSANGLVVGAVLDYAVSKDARISFQPSLQQSGATIAFDIPGTEETRDSIAIGLDYLHLPLLARVLTDGGRWYVTGGPYLGLLQTAEGERVDGGGEVVDVSDEVKSFDLGLIFGIGHMFPIDPVKVNVELRWTQGVTSIDQREDEDWRVWNRGRHLHIGVLYTFGQ